MMLTDTFVEVLFVSTVGICAGVAILLVSMVAFRKEAKTARQLMLEVSERPAFLFDGTDLLDASPAARDLLSQADTLGTDWDRVLSVLQPSFPGLSEQIAKLGEKQALTLEGGETAHGLILEAEFWDGLVRIALSQPEPGWHSGHTTGGDAVAIAALESELSTLRTLAEDSPQLIWRLDSNEQITWANRAYLDVAMSMEGGQTNDLLSWPPKRVFETITAAPLHGEPTRRRVPVPIGSDGAVDWFEVTSLRRGTGSVHFAADANGVVRAEKAQRDFVQTLTKTFADLNTGMIIFDRHRRLVLFNPAFLDMSGLPPDFLSGRPVIQSVLDRLREAHVLPEPKDYATWRDQMVELESAAKDGTYSENWNLPTGQTFRVTGRPHPDGAIAFLFEDITSEISLTRRFRSELEFGQAVIDNIEEAVVVFSAAGTQIATNQKYVDLWRTDEPTIGSDLSDVTLSDSIALWMENCVPSPVWGDLRDFVTDPRERCEWSDTVRLMDGRTIQCRFVPLVGGTTMVSFLLRHADIDDDLDLPLSLASASG